VADEFVFVHLPRTGGTFVIDVIKKFFPSAREVGHHLPLELLPSQYRHLPVLGTVRNPWDFYVSLYHYILAKNPDSILGAWMKDETYSFQESAQTLLNFGVDNVRLDSLIDMLPEDMDYTKRQIPNLSKNATRRMRGKGLGYYSSRFGEMFGDADNVFFCRVETLRQDLVGFFDTIGATTENLRNYVLRLERKNTSAHLHYSIYYTSELAELVSVRERLLIDRFGYQFESPCSKPARKPSL